MIPVEIVKVGRSHIAYSRFSFSLSLDHNIAIYYPTSEFGLTLSIPRVSVEF